MEEVPRRLGSYEVQSELGKGGMGRVYKAVQPSLNRTVAIKVLPEKFARDPKEAERFHREAQAVAMISHPNVVQIIDKDQEGEALYFVMEYVEGDSLAQLLRKRRLTLSEALDIFMKICAGLEAAHGKEIVHRDLNPRNVLVSEDLSIVKLADFGISRVKSVSQTMGTLSTTRFTMGTLPYMSPEQLASMAEVDHRSDIYSAGALLYEMLTGVVPLGEFTPPSQLNEELAPEVDGLVLKCLAGEPEDRYQTVAELLEATRRVEHFFGDASVRESTEIPAAFATKLLETSTTPAAEPAAAAAASGSPATSGRRRMLLVSALLVSLGVVAAAAVLWQRRPAPQEPAPPTRGTLVEVPETPRFEAGAAGSGGAAAGLPEDLEVPPAGEEETDARQARRAAEEQARAAAAAGRDEALAAPQPEAPRPAPPRPGAWAPDLAPIRRQIAAGDLDGALAGLRSVLAKHPRGAHVPVAYLLLAGVHRQRSEYEEAVAALTVIESRFDGSPEAPEAFFLHGSLVLKTGGRGRALEALQLFDQVGKRYPRSPRAAPALEAKAAIERQEKIQLQDAVLGRRVPAELMSYRTLAENYPRHPAAEDALWQLGKLYESLERSDLAAETFETLGDRFPATAYDAWWEAGQLYERKLGNADRARAAYRRVPDGSRSFAKAQRRLRKLGS